MWTNPWKGLDMHSVAHDEQEIWKAIPGLEGTHEVSSLGRVRSLDHVVISKVGRVIHRKSRIYKLTPSAYGYPMANLKRQKYLVHHLVLLAFVGPKEKGMGVLHRDDDKTNNRLSNLYYGSHSENMQDCVRNGHHTNAEKTHCRLGHEYSGSNVIIAKRGNGKVFRQCRVCRKLAQHKYDAKRRDYAA
ncbi:hypothetical protein GMA1_68 [Gordonia phage GMA1]|uniref:HNH endonuclease n=1 Tax=Gordonia phage GMA1 TaxID=1647470 RepID=UPI0007B64AD4|nr:HNH endonuclease [Gordonia phage GMA1]AKJ72165.1 hypothetical protein GMA1_68 [Gordonia phage GMA1]